MAPFAAWGAGKGACPPSQGFPFCNGAFGVAEVPSSAHPSSRLATFLLSLPPSGLPIRRGWVPRGGQCDQGAADAVWQGADGRWWRALGGSEEGQDGETLSAWRGQPENCLTF